MEREKREIREINKGSKKNTKKNMINIKMRNRVARETRGIPESLLSCMQVGKQESKGTCFRMDCEIGLRNVKLICKIDCVCVSVRVRFMLN